MVPLNHSDRFTVSKALLEFSGVDNVGKKQSQQPSTMFALKFFNLCPSLDRDSLQFPGGHEHQSTKVSRWNQWENGSNGRGRMLHIWPFRSNRGTRLRDQLWLELGFQFPARI